MLTAGELFQHWQDRGLSRQSAAYFEVRAEHDRLWLPIHTTQGEEIGAQGWCPLPDDAKYKNVRMPDRSLKMCLLNLHRIKGMGGRVFVTEGTLDAVSVHQAGFPCVATAGVSPGLSPARLVILNRYFDTIVFLIDNDKEGRDAGETAMDAAAQLGIGLQVFATSAPRCKDANDILKEHGLDALIQFLRNVDAEIGGHHEV